MFFVGTIFLCVRFSWASKIGTRLRWTTNSSRFCRKTYTSFQQQDSNWALWRPFHCLIRRSCTPRFFTANMQLVILHPWWSSSHFYQTPRSKIVQLSIITWISFNKHLIARQGVMKPGNWLLINSDVCAAQYRCSTAFFFCKSTAYLQFYINFKSIEPSVPLVVVRI